MPPTKIEQLIYLLEQRHSILDSVCEPAAFEGHCEKYAGCEGCLFSSKDHGKELLDDLKTALPIVKTQKLIKGE